MPKTNNPLTRAKTSPGVSYTIPATKLVDFVSFDGDNIFLVALDPAEEALFNAAVTDLIHATYPGYDGIMRMPIITWGRRLCLRVSGQFEPVIRGPDGKPRERVRNGTTVTVRAMVKVWMTQKGVDVHAFPSRIDIHGRGKRKPKPIVQPVQLDMVLESPAETIAESAPITKPKAKKATKPKPAPKTKAPVAFDKAAYAAHRARVVEARARKAKAKAKAAPVTPTNVIPFPINRTRRPVL